ncbi:sugar phosphate isomerase/epimerase family protein [Microbacterium thalassium]|uniref:D-psicose/D-tagatose/L-ribulose 3-epimerase n=1 Tax=Microbacterium thalassium TaxID=362649 RepID=A0A7X0FNH9_9MICO|nr:sugar phosphate isomerase/epimerase family protein [Microbacterium thalassium]MBB6390674.1 D-psicose/D-tagatose/L-ribulose 3-epimerase [Microbacterium thalassium]GLK25783.1 epimerase [Microbacterium thalassium]
MTFELDIACHLSALVPDPSGDAVPAALDAVAAAGYRRVVLPPMPLDLAEAERLRVLITDRGLEPIAMCGQTPDADVSSPDAAVREAGLRSLREALAFTLALGADQLNGVPYAPFGASAPTGADAIERSAKDVGLLADEAHDSGVTLTFEVLNRYETSFVNTADQAMRYVELSGSDHLRIHLDTFHMAVEEADMSAAIRTALPRLAFLELGQSGRGLLSQGTVPVADVVRQALDDGYEGRFGLEAFSRPLMAEPVADMLAIWRDTYDDGTVIARDAMDVIRQGWAASTVGRRAQRLARGATGPIPQTA